MALPWSFLVFLESKQVDKTDLTNVLVSVFKISSTGMVHFGEMHFPFFLPASL